MKEYYEIEQQADGTFRFGPLTLQRKSVVCGVDHYWVTETKEWMTETAIRCMLDEWEQEDERGSV